jgi:outer membrane lipoprotein-sorting protein
VLKNTPKDAGGVEFSYYVVTVDAQTFLPRKAEYYDKNGKLYRVISAVEVRDVEGFPTIVKMKSEDLNAKASTVTEFTKMDYNTGLSDDTFTERYLRTPPAGM